MAYQTELSKQEPCTYQQRLSIAMRTGDWSVMDREMSLGAAGEWVRKLKEQKQWAKGQTCKAERDGRK